MTKQSTIHTGKFDFVSDDPLYRDHFPGAPTVPGTLIIHAFYQQASKVSCSEIGGVKGFRFKQFIAPSTYEFTMEETATLFKCTLFSQGKAAVTGTLEKAC